MGAIRGYVFPALRILMWGLIAISLAWLAFFRAGPSVDDETAQPSADVTPPLVTVARGDISNTVSLTGQVAADPAVEVKVTQAGEISTMFLRPGAVVSVGTPIAEVRYERKPPSTP
ncbi:MAG: secretion protein HlyD, partial [Actinomycetota bacterium]|nr:secretion protein HlyD [Actinomycetota bacterium]